MFGKNLSSGFWERMLTSCLLLHAKVQSCRKWDFLKYLEQWSVAVPSEKLSRETLRLGNFGSDDSFIATGFEDVGGNAATGESR